ncbi:MAG: hypothetical protein Q9218_000897 [Villophora microphyllina]
MARQSKLLAALDAHKNINHKAERQKKLQKQAAKRTKPNNLGHPNKLISVDQALMSGALPFVPGKTTVGEKESRSDATPVASETSHVHDSLNISADEGRLAEMEPAESSTAALLWGHEDGAHNREDSEESLKDSPEGDIPLSDIASLSEAEEGNIMPHQRLTINNTAAIGKAYNAIALPIAKLPFSEHHIIVSTGPAEIPDVNDDLNRELVLHQQCLHAAQEARNLLKKEGVPFSRPSDYFAEMVKSDEQMGRIKQKMTDGAANKKAAAEARKQRDLKRFGKQVQVAKLQERDKARRETLDKINILKRKRKSTDTRGAEETDMFDVALEDASKAEKVTTSVSTGPSGRTSAKRQKKDDKFGFGGKKRFAKSGNAISTSDLRTFSAKRMKGQKKGAQRPGKSRRAQKV